MRCFTGYKKVRRDECTHATYVEALVENGRFIYFVCRSCGASLLPKTK